MNMRVGKAHKPFYGHIKNGGKVWRNDPLNDIKEVFSKDHPALKEDLTEICRFGYTNLHIIKAEEEHLFYDYFLEGI